MQNKNLKARTVDEVGNTGPFFLFASQIKWNTEWWNHIAYYQNVKSANLSHTLVAFAEENSEVATEKDWTKIT
jgi:hypothetical protein